MKQTKEQITEFRAVPQSPDAEIAVLGSCITSQDACDIVFQIIEGKEFYKESHRKMYMAIYSLREAQIAVDIITLADELKRMGEFEKIGGTSALSALIDQDHHAANVEHYAQIVKEKFYSRQLIKAATNIAASAYEDALPIRELMDVAVDQISDAVQGHVKRIEDTPQENILQVQKHLADIQSGKTRASVPTRIRQLDEAFGGFDSEGVTSVVGPTKIGKSILLQNIAVRCATEGRKIPVGYAIPDKPKLKTLERFASVFGGISTRHWHSTDKMLMPDAKRQAIYDKWANSKLYVVGQDDIERDIKKFGYWVMRAKAKYGLEMVILDSASNLMVPKGWGETDEKRESEKCYFLTELAQKAKIALVAVVEMANTVKGEEKTHFERSKGTATWKYQPLAAWGIYKSKLTDGGLNVKLEAANDKKTGMECELSVDPERYTVN